MISYEEALKKAAAYCAKHETCTFDLKRKLLQWKIPEQFHEKIIHYLTENQFIDNLRYTHSFVNDKFFINHWGRIKIRYALHQKNIDDNIIDRVFDEIITEEKYLDTLRDILHKKLKTLKENDRNRLKTKLINFALQRGFEKDLAFQISDELLKETE